MSVSILHTEVENAPAVRFIGKKYRNGSYWHEWWENGWFSVLEKGDLSPLNDGGYIGLMRDGPNGFEYWIGMFFEEGEKVPSGFDYLDLPQHQYAVCYLHGNPTSGELFGGEPYRLCLEYLEDLNMEYCPCEWRFERYSCPRWTSPDENGDVTLDMAFALQ